MTSVASDRWWEDRLAVDAERARVCQSSKQRALTSELCLRARETGVLALALTGSTTRRRRTAVSDLDYHVIGPRLDLRDLPGELDVVTDSEERFFERLLSGDDFAQWTLRFGCVLLDTRGVLRRGWELVEGEGLWPDAEARFGAQRRWRTWPGRSWASAIRTPARSRFVSP